MALNIQLLDIYLLYEICMHMNCVDVHNLSLVNKNLFSQLIIFLKDNLIFNNKELSKTFIYAKVGVCFSPLHQKMLEWAKSHGNNQTLNSSLIRQHRNGYSDEQLHEFLWGNNDTSYYDINFSPMSQINTTNWYYITEINDGLNKNYYDYDSNIYVRTNPIQTMFTIYFNSLGVIFNAVSLKVTLKHPYIWKDDIFIKIITSIEMQYDIFKISGISNAAIAHAIGLWPEEKDDQNTFNIPIITPNIISPILFYNNDVHYGNNIIIIIEHGNINSLIKTEYQNIPIIIENEIEFEAEVSHRSITPLFLKNAPDLFAQHNIINQPLLSPGYELNWTTMNISLNETNPTYGFIIIFDQPIKFNSIEIWNDQILVHSWSWENAFNNNWLQYGKRPSKNEYWFLCPIADDMWNIYSENIINFSYMRQPTIHFVGLTGHAGYRIVQIVLNVMKFPAHTLLWNYNTK
jgi:hypothetical protein